MADYLAHLANCILCGTDFCEIEKDGKRLRYRCLIPIHIDGFQVELHQEPDIWVHGRRRAGTFVTATKLYVRDVAPADVDRVKDLIRKLSEMLSFATESRVLAHTHEYPAGSGLIHGISCSGTIQTWRPPFDDPADAKRFLESCYSRYSSLREPRMLHVAVDYIHHSILKGLAEEVKIGLACIAFENLRDNWARDAGYRHIGGYFREKTATAVKKGQPVPLRRHLTEMFDEVGMSADVDRIVGTRNEVLHTGLYGQITGDTHDFLETTLREYFLRLVGYRGNFMPYIGGSPTPRHIP